MTARGGGQSPARAVGALLLLREWRLEQSRLDWEQRRREVDAATWATRAAEAAISGALGGSAQDNGPPPALHAFTLRHFVGLAAHLQRAAAELESREATASESREKLGLRARELDVLRRACEHASAGQRAAAVRAAWSRADDDWLAARSTQVGA
jgi:hypothetical protein